MIRSACILSLVFLLNSLCLRGQSTDTLVVKKAAKEKPSFPRQPLIIKTSPTALLFGGIFPLTSEYRLMVEITGNRKQSDQLGISLLGKSFLWEILEKNSGTNASYKIRGLRIQYSHRFYLVTRKGFAPHGFYFSPMFSYANAKVAPSKAAKVNDVYYDFKNINMNLLIGVQTGKGKNFSIDFYLGPGVKSTTVLFYEKGTSRPYPAEDFGPLFNSKLNFVLGMNIGYCLY